LAARSCTVTPTSARIDRGEAFVRSPAGEGKGGKQRAVPSRRAARELPRDAAFGAPARGLSRRPQEQR
jgi:hypothetical protein